MVKVKIMAKLLINAPKKILGIYWVSLSFIYQFNKKVGKYKELQRIIYQFNKNIGKHKETIYHILIKKISYSYRLLETLIYQFNKKVIPKQKWT